MFQPGLYLANAASAACFAPATQIRKDGNDQMGCEPDIVVTHVLVNIDEDENPREQNAEKYICPLRHEVSRIKLREQKKIYQQDYTRDEQREKKKIEVHKPKNNSLITVMSIF